MTNRHEDFLKQPPLLIAAWTMNIILTLFVKVSAIYLFSLGVFFLLKDQLFSVDKFGPLPLGYAVIFLCIAAISASALYLSANAKRYNVISKGIIGLIILPYLVVFSIDSFDCYHLVFQNRYREGLLYIFSLSTGTLSCLTGILLLIFTKKPDKY